MPIYEYQCVKCKQIDEHLMRMSDPEPAECSKCGSMVSRIVSQTSFALKGGGWYVTDYKTSSTPKAETGAQTGVEAGALSGREPGAESKGAERKVSEKTSDSSGVSEKVSKPEPKLDSAKAVE